VAVAERVSAPVTRWRAYLPLLVVGAVAVLIRVPFFAWPLTGDEGNYAYTAYWWMRGQPLYVDYFGLEKPQGLFVVYLLPVLLGGDTWLFRFWGALWMAATSVVVTLLASRLISPRAALASGAIYTIFSALPTIEGQITNAETFMVLPLTLSAYCLYLRKFGLAGITAGLAIAFKPSAASGVLLAVFWLLWTRSSRRDAVRLILGLLPVPIVMLAHGVWSAGLDSYLYAVALFRTQARTVPQGSLLLRFAVQWTLTIGAWLPLAAAARAGSGSLERTARTLLVAWGASSLIGMGASGHWHFHYWIQLMPPLGIMAAAGLIALWETTRPSARILCVLVAVVPILLIAPYLTMSPQQASWRAYARPGQQIEYEVAAYIQARTEPSDSIYVAWSEASIYYLAQRRAAVPFLSYIQTVDNVGAYDRIVASIEQKQPAYVLALDAPLPHVDPDGRFWQALDRGYRVEATFDGVPLYVRGHQEADRSAEGDAQNVGQDVASPKTP
jgi:drug/metabolite transporter superfamily protein YnfA